MEPSFKITTEYRPFKDNANAEWVRVMLFANDGSGTQLILGLAVEKYGSKENAVDAAKKYLTEKLSKTLTNNIQSL